MAFSFCAVCALAYCWRKRSTSTLSFRASERAVTSPLNQLYESRNGRATRFAATSNGFITAAPVFCTTWSGPSEDSRNETVISASETRTSPTTTARRSNGDRERPVGEVEAGRRTEESSTANRDVRLRVRVATS